MLYNIFYKLEILDTIKLQTHQRVSIKTVFLYVYQGVYKVSLPYVAFEQMRMNTCASVHAHNMTGVA